jgi:predicted MFS family arabinose efflux permease
MNGNWSQLDMTKNLHSSATQASFALTAFWGMVTVGRVLFAMVQRRFPPHLTYRVLPFLLAAVFVVIAALPSRAPAAGIVAFALAGFGCSARNRGPVARRVSNTQRHQTTHLGERASIGRGRQSVAGA